MPWPPSAKHADHGLVYPFTHQPLLCVFRALRAQANATQVKRDKRMTHE